MRAERFGKMEGVEMIERILEGGKIVGYEAVERYHLKNVVISDGHF